MKTNKIKYLISGLLLLLAGCGETGEMKEKEAEHAEEHNEEEVHMVQRQMDVMGIKLGGFDYKNLSTTVKSNGRLELPPQNKASVSSLMAGRVSDVAVIQGDYVKKGQRLASLEHPAFVEMQENYFSSKMQLGYLEKEYQRKKSLFADSINSAKSLQKAEVEFLSANAKVEALAAKLNMLGLPLESMENGKILSAIPVRSPISGYVHLVEVNMGKFIQPEQELFEIVDIDHIHIDLKVYEKDIDKVKVGQKVIFSLSNKPDSAFEGQVFAVGKAFEDQPKALAVHAEISNKSRNLLPGMYVDARIITDQKQARSLPEEAVVQDGGLDYIFVLVPGKSHAHASGSGHDHADGHENEFVFRKIEVNKGAVDIGFVEVVPAYNITDKSQIVTKGAYYLMAEMKKGESGHGHHH